MNINEIAIGKNVPDDVNAIIEVPTFGAPVKYEMDKDSGSLHVDRFLGTAMHYPCNYGFVPHTLAEDGDPLDILVITSVPLLAGVVISVRPVGMLHMEDEAGGDAKVLAVPVQKLSPLYDNVNEYTDVPQSMLDEIAHFFEQYKALEPGKWARVDHWSGVEEAKAEIRASIERAK
ncbi:MAG: inorganic diphosphatase [Halofilum sp. (in: g-proteobacteria)]